MKKNNDDDFDNDEIFEDDDDSEEVGESSSEEEEGEFHSLDTSPALINSEEALRASLYDNSHVAGLLREFFDDDSLKEIIPWLAGTRKDPPAVMQKVINNIQMKMTWLTAYMVTGNLSRLGKLQPFLTRAEQILFPVSYEELVNMDRETLEARYRLAIQAQEKAMEFTRKFASQSKETFEDKQTEGAELMDKILQLPPERVKKILEALEKGDL
jgi:hypothetical protein